MVKDKINKIHQVAGWKMEALRIVSALAKSFIFKQHNCKSYKLWKISLKYLKKNIFNFLASMLFRQKIR